MICHCYMYWKVGINILAVGLCLPFNCDVAFPLFFIVHSFVQVTLSYCISLFCTLLKLCKSAVWYKMNEALKSSSETLSAIFLQNCSSESWTDGPLSLLHRFLSYSLMLLQYCCMNLGWYLLQFVLWGSSSILLRVFSGNDETFFFYMYHKNKWSFVGFILQSWEE